MRIHDIIMVCMGLLTTSSFPGNITCLVHFEWTCWDSNPGPSPCKGDDLPTDLQALGGSQWILVDLDLAVFRFLTGCDDRRCAGQLRR